MLRIDDLFWNDENVGHLWDAHQVTPDEVEEVLFGADGEAPSYRVRRDGAFHVVYGETGSGRLLILVGELLEERRFRPFAARDMAPNERRNYRKR